ncbi:MAG: response regulator [Planctomycetota bacterium]|jgi:two-component system response regulator PilR (NtrC family)
MDRQVKLLVVDDEFTMRHLIENVLKQEGYQVDVSSSGIEALKMMETCYYHMLLTDFNMPGIDGMELIRNAKKQNSEIRTIMISGNTTIDIATPTLSQGIDNYIPKPFKIFDLKKTVKQTLYSHKIVLAII